MLIYPGHTIGRYITLQRLSQAFVGGYLALAFRSTSANTSESVVPSALASLSACTIDEILFASRQEAVLPMSGSLCTTLTGRRHVAR
jgi:hypothetical protein